MNFSNQLVGQVISGEELNRLLNGMPLLKFMNDDDKHYEMQYETGYNLDILPFNGSGDCKPGGLYVTTLEHAMKYFYLYGKYARRVRIESNALVYVEPCKLKCDEVYLEEKVLKEDLLRELFNEITPELTLAIVKNTGSIFFEFIKEDKKTPELLMEIVKNNGLAIEVINDDKKTPELLMEAVKSDGCALKYIKDDMKTHDLMIEAVKNSGYALRFIKNGMRTTEIMIEAVKNDGFILKYIKDDMKTPEIIMTAIKSNQHAIYYIRDDMKTPEIMAAIAEYDGRM